MNLEVLRSLPLSIACFICNDDIDSIFSFGGQLRFLQQAIAANIWQNYYPFLERALPIVALSLPVLILIILNQRRWLAFILGIFSFAIPMRLHEILECLLPNRYCSGDNFETGVDCGFQIINIALGIAYNILMLGLILIISDWLREPDRK